MSFKKELLSPDDLIVSLQAVLLLLWVCVDLDLLDF